MKRLLSVATTATVLLALSSCSANPQAANPTGVVASTSTSSSSSTASPPTSASASPAAGVPTSAAPTPKSTPAVTPAASPNSPSPSPAPASSSASPLHALDLNTHGNVPQKVGQLTTFGQASGEKFAVLKADSVQLGFKCPANTAKPSVNGQFVALKISITANTDFPNSGWPSFAMSANDFKAWDANGAALGDPVGNSAGCVDPAKLLPSNIEPGSSASGLIILDVAKSSGSASYAIGGFEGSYGWEWSW